MKKYKHIPADRSARVTDLKYDYEAQPKQYIDACNLCGGTKLVTISHVDRYGYRCTADACSACSLVFLNPVMTPEAYGDFYAEVYRPLVSAYHGRKIDRETIQEEQAEYAEALCGIIKNWISARRETRLLDIGGSTGVVSREIVKKFNGVAATIIDPAADEIVVAKEYGMETINGFVEEYDPGEKKYDLVILCQTVDHLLNAKGTLDKVKSLLSADGAFFVDIVDFRAAYLRNGSVEGAVKIDHPYYFTEETIELMLSMTGFNVLKKVYAEDKLHIGYLCNVNGLTGKEKPSETFVRDFFREIREVQNSRHG